MSGCLTNGVHAVKEEEKIQISRLIPGAKGLQEVDHISHANAAESISKMKLEK